MYLEHFGLSWPPFRITPNTSLFFGGGNREPVLEALIYAISQGAGMIKVIGEAGSGKTTLCRMLQSKLPAHIEIIYLANPNVTPEEILRAITQALRLKITAGANRLAARKALHTHLLKRHAQQHQIAIFVEEVQTTSLAVLEEIFALSNLEKEKHKLLQIVLFGQPKLNENLRQPHTRQLRERITHSFNLSPLTPKETMEYLSFRLRRSGYRGPDLFNQRIANRIAKLSNGSVRRTNIIADKILLTAFTENIRTLKLKYVGAAAYDSEFSADPDSRKMSALTIAAILTILLCIILGVGYPLYHLPPIKNAVTLTVIAPVTETPQVEAQPIDPIEDRIKATKNWLQTHSQSTYSIQIMGSNNRELLLSYLDIFAKTIKIDNIFMYRTLAKKKQIITVLYGSFTSKKKAMKAMAGLPNKLKSHHPYLRTIRGIRTEIDRNKTP